MRADRGEQPLRLRPLQQHDARADAQRKQQQRAEPERERERRGAAEHVVGVRLQHVLRKAMADRHHVAMKVHGRLRAPRRARRERDDARLVGARIDRLERARARVQQRLERGRVVGLVVPGERDARRRRHRGAQLGGHRRLAQRVRDLRLRDDFRQLARAQQRHRRHHDAARLDDREPCGGEKRMIGSVQQHPVARHEPAVAHQQVGDPVAQLEQRAIRPGGAGLGPDRDALAPAPPGHRVVEQRRRAVDARRILQARQLEDELRQIGRCRQIRAAKVVHRQCSREVD